MLTLTIVRQRRDNPVSESFELPVPDRHEAAVSLRHFRDDSDNLSAFLWDGTSYLGSGVAGNGRCLYSW